MFSSDKLRISLEEIVLATNDFAEETIIGKGGFGTVYQGQSRQHGLLAIKRLNPLFGQGVHEYGMEVTLLSKYKHENLVSLIGFCRENGEKILVYKYEANLSLDKVLHIKELSWMRRLHICLGAARGLMYLHNETGSEHGVIHRDIKSPNILLDENWNAKISDFGLSKIALTNSADSVVFTRACGTNGYVDPQLLLGYGVTQKSDVYSFGVVLYEVLFGKLVGQPRDHRFTVKMAKSYYKENILHKMIVSGLIDELNSDSLSTFSTIAFQCLKKRREDRPTMSLVVEALEKALDYQQASSLGLYGGNLNIRLQEILSTTNGFDEANIIGIGGYGIMYLGDSEQHGMLAIKRLNDVYSRQGDNEYEMEVTLLSKYKHENLVRLVGFCGEDGEQILVYKYEANQSLDKFLHSKDLSWMRRLQICLGAAQGLSYLHNEAGSEQGVIHSDIKSSNIILDENWNAKILDYGLSKIQPQVDVTCGTPGYVDPQIYQDGDITQKSDVYSFGVVLYEVLFGKLVIIPGYLHDGRFTVKMAKMHYEEKTLHMMIDPDLGNEINSDSLSTFSTIAYQCLKKRKEYRPTMSSVVEALEKALGYQQAAPLTRVSA